MSAPFSLPPHVVEDCRGVLRVYSDGSIVRSPTPTSAPSLSPSATPPPSVWKDIEFDPSNGLHLRLYKPPNLRQEKLPVFFYFHGGGFCIGSRTSPHFHNCGLRLAADLPALVVAPDYRLAPEHPLPAAVHDAVAAVDWIRAQAASPDPDPFLADSADFGRVFVSGESAGGNLAHHLAVRFGSDPGRAELDPIAIRGFVLLMPFFGGADRTRSEAECPKEAFLNLELSDRYWRLALPLGATRDHPLANPFAPGAPVLDPVEMAPVLVVAGEKDLLRDRNVEYARRLRELGKAVELLEIKGQDHGFFALNALSESVDELIRVIRRFVEETGGGASCDG